MGEEFESWSHLISNLIRHKLYGEKLNVYTITDYFSKHWQISIYYSIVYLVLIHYGNFLMTKRQPFNLRLPLAIWSGTLSLFSIMGSIATVPEFFHIWTTKGFVSTYCDNSYIQNQNLVFWYTAFSLSKVAELFDTGFIVLRKQKLILLHWIHHVLTLVYTFYIYGFMAASARWMVCMNLVVHSIMYGYYALRALRISVPRIIALSITISQIVQMIFGLITHGHIFIKLYFNKQQCDCPLQGTVWALLMYLLYLYFFVKFFFDSYNLKMMFYGKNDEKIIQNDKQKLVGNNLTLRKNIKISLNNNNINNNDANSCVDNDEWPNHYVENEDEDDKLDNIKDNNSNGYSFYNNENIQSSNKKEL